MNKLKEIPPPQNNRRNTDHSGRFMRFDRSDTCFIITLPSLIPVRLVMCVRLSLPLGQHVIDMKDPPSAFICGVGLALAYILPLRSSERVNHNTGSSLSRSAEHRLVSLSVGVELMLNSVVGGLGFKTSDQQVFIHHVVFFFCLDETNVLFPKNLLIKCESRSY